MRNRPLLLGHRGARSVSEIPENTLASFDVALKKGADGFEFDVRLTRDGIPVIFHDPAFHRKAVSSLSHEQLLALAADEGGPAGRFPTLGQVVRGYGHVFLDIELKVPDCEALVLDALRESPPSRNYVISSFLPEAILAVSELNENLPIGLIAESSEQLRLWRRLPVQYAIPEMKLVSERLVEEVHESGKMVLVWTVNRPDDMRRLAEWGVDGIISDDVELLARTLG